MEKTISRNLFCLHMILMLIMYVCVVIIVSNIMKVIKEHNKAKRNRTTLQK